MDVISALERQPGGHQTFVESIWEDVHGRDAMLRMWACRQIAALNLWVHVEELHEGDAQSGLADELGLLAKVANILEREAQQ